MTLELASCTSTLLREIGDKTIKRNSLAVTYALALQSSEPTDWAAVNRAIIARWSKSALEYIKRRAWAIVKKSIYSPVRPMANRS